MSSENKKDTEESESSVSEDESKSQSHGSEDKSKSGSEDKSKSGSEDESKSGSEDGTKSGSFLDVTVDLDETVTEPEDNDYTGALARVDISHDDLFFPSSPIGNPTQETQQELDRHSQNKYQFLENFYNENYKKLNDFEMMRSFLTDIMIENMPDLMHGIESPRLIGEGIKFIIDDLKQRFNKYKITIFDDEERELSNEEIMGKIKNLGKKANSLFTWYATEMTKINEENFILKDQNAKLKAYVHSLQKSNEEDESGGLYTGEKLRRFLYMSKRENQELNEVLNQVKDYNSQLWLLNAELRKDLVTGIAEKQILAAQLAQVLDVKKMFHEAVVSVLEKDEDSAEKPSKDSCRDMLQKWIHAMEDTFAETGERLHQTLSKLDQIRDDATQKETEIMEVKEQFEELDHQIDLLNQTLYMKKVNSRELETTIKYMSQRIQIDNKYSEDLRKIYEEYKKLHHVYMGRHRNLSSTTDSPVSSEEMSTSHPSTTGSSASSSKSHYSGVSHQVPDFDMDFPSQADRPGFDDSRAYRPQQSSQGSYHSPIIKGPIQQRGAYGTLESPVIKPRYIAHDTPVPTSETRAYGSEDFRTYDLLGRASPYAEEHYKKQRTSSRFRPEEAVDADFSPSPMIKGYVDPGTPSSDFTPSPIIKGYVDPGTSSSDFSPSPIIKGYVDPGTSSSDFSQSPIIKGYVDPGTPSTGSWKARHRTTESPNTLVKSMLLSSPGRKNPLKVDVEVDPKPLRKTASGDHFMCDISVNMQDVNKRLPWRETTPYRRRKMAKTYRYSPPPLTVAKSRRPRGIYTPKTAFRRQMIGRRDLFGEGYQSPEPPHGSGRWHDPNEYDLQGWERPERRLDQSIPWESPIIKPRYTQSPQSGSTLRGSSPRKPDALDWSPFSFGSPGATPYYQSDRLSEPTRKTKFVSPSGRPMRIFRPETPRSLQ
ncbi:uncharacterized protein [Parasteatoda tepidariorum]